MDRTTIIGFVLIGLVLMLWMWLMAPPPVVIPPSDKDSIMAKQSLRDSAKVPFSQATPTNQSSDTLGKFFTHLATGQGHTFTVETKLYTADISTRGGGISSWQFKNYKTWNQHPAVLFSSSNRGECNLVFYSSDGKRINTGDLNFQLQNRTFGNIVLSERDSIRVDFVLPISKQSRIVKTMRFGGSSYSVDVSYRFEGMQDIISNFKYQLVWEDGLNYFEHNSVDESNHAKAAALSGGELTEIDAHDFNAAVKMDISGKTNWVAMRNKYFAVAIIPREKESQAVYVEGRRSHEPNGGALEHYSMSVEVPFTGRPIETDRYTIYIGPLDFDIVKSYDVGLDQIMSLGSVWVIRPISEYVILPLFKFLHWFIPNYGIVLIIFALIVKIALYPLTKSSMESMRKMQKLQPMMNEIREKHKDDPQKMNQQVMRLYKEYGVNPAGGCLPMLLQLPILYALWSVFSSTIELRQTSFIWWITDLSVPDEILQLPFHIPIFGIDKLSGLALLMGVTMFVQQKMSIQDPRQKMMIWLMPIMLTLLFNSFPSGLNLYYFMFNVLSIIQQGWMNKQHSDEPLKKVDENKRSGGIIGRLSKHLPDMKR